MTKGSIISPDPSAFLPLLNLVPVKGSVSELGRYTSAFFARFEQVQKGRSASDDAEVLKRLASEEAMLKVVLEWLSVKPG